MAVPVTKQGWLLKWTNYMKGFQERWVVLEHGVLCYYRYDSTPNCPTISLTIVLTLVLILTLILILVLAITRNPIPILDA